MSAPTNLGFDAYSKRMKPDSYDFVGLVLKYPEKFTADSWYEAMRLLMAERAPA